MQRVSVRPVCTVLASVLALVLVPGWLAAQEGAIAGRVTDVQSGAGLSAVQVEVLRADGSVAAGALTGSEGTYRIAEVPAGSYVVQFALPGWTLEQRADVRVAAGQTTSVSVGLTERSFNLNPITVTTSKTEEKVLDAPAAVQVLSTADIAEEPAVTIADHVRDVSAVDVITTGLQGNYIVARGFNNIFSGAMLTLTDNRIARVPSLRANISHLQPTTNLDLERIEVVLGPGSALYGPNAANGVLHAITKSPIDYPGFTFSVGNGLRQQDDTPGGVSGSDEYTFQGEGRIAVKTPDDRFGVKLSGQYFTGEDYRFVDPVEEQQRGLADACIASGFDLGNPACLNFSQGLDIAQPEDQALLRESVLNVAAGRDNDLERWALDLRADYRPSEDLSIILSGGRTTAVNSVDLTGLGAGQVVDWGYWYGQARFQYQDWFGQVFFNKSDNEDTYLLRSGRPLIDKSSLLVAQLQHSAPLNESQAFVYGFDLLRTAPQTEGTINGQNESDDEITEVGGYLQSETVLSEQFDLVLAARVDNHSELDDPVFSPRAALVFHPDQENSFRLTYNRAFSTPTTLNLFLDISGGAVPIPGTPFRYDVRAQGPTPDGLQFRRTGGVPDFLSPFAPLIGQSQRTFLPTSTGQLWALAKELVRAGDSDAGQVLDLIPAPTGADVPVVGLLANPNAGPGEAPFLPTPVNVAGLDDIPSLDPTITNTIEAGYKGLLGNKLLFSANVYYSRIDDWVSALRVSTPNVFLEGNALGAYLTEQFTALVGIAFPDEATAQAAAAQIAGQIGQVPLGVVTPAQAGGTEAPIILTYRNLGDFDLWGADLSFSYLVSDQLELSGSAAWVSDDTFASGTELVPLNAPTFKGSAGVHYRNDESGLSAHGRGRFVDAFPVNSGVYVGDVDSYWAFDVNLGYEIPGFRGLRAHLDVQNVFDSGYQTFVGTPELGRFSVLRLVYTH